MKVERFVSSRKSLRLGVISGALRKPQSGLTLVELLVVLVVLAALGGILSVTLSDGASLTGTDGIERTDEEIATRATMTEVRDAMMATSLSEPGYFQDTGSLPERLGGLISQSVAGEGDFDPARKRGWRGPYVYDTGSPYENYVESDGSDNFDDDGGNPYGQAGDPAILDAWGKPLILQESANDDARLVSAGPNRVLETDPDSSVDANRGDDLILFLLSSDPNL